MRSSNLRSATSAACLASMYLTLARLAICSVLVRQLESLRSSDLRLLASLSAYNLRCFRCAPCIIQSTVHSLFSQISYNSCFILLGKE